MQDVIAVVVLHHARSTAVHTVATVRTFRRQRAMRDSGRVHERIDVTPRLLCEQAWRRSKSVSERAASTAVDRALLSVGQLLVVPLKSKHMVSR